MEHDKVGDVHSNAFEASEKSFIAVSIELEVKLVIVIV